MNKKNNFWHRFVQNRLEHARREAEKYMEEMTR